MLSDLITRLVALSCRRPWAVTLVVAAVVGVSLAYAISHFSMDTDTTNLISAKVRWRQDEAAVSRAFPQNDDLIVAVVDGATPELAEDAAARLSARLSGERKAFESVRQAGRRAVLRARRAAVLPAAARCAPPPPS